MAKKQQKKRKNASNKQPAMLVYVKDWLTSVKLKRAGAAAKGIWADFMFQTYLTPGNRGVFDYAKLGKDVSILLEHLLKQKDKQNLKDASNLLGDLIHKEEAFCSEFENVFGYNKEEFCVPLAKLLITGAAKINANGYLYSSRMVRDADISEKRAAAGSKGGKETQRKAKGEGDVDSENEGKDNDSFASTFAQANFKQSTANANANEYNNKEEESVKGEEDNVLVKFGNANLPIPEEVMSFYSKTFEQFKSLGPGVAGNLLARDFDRWKKFVDFIVSNNMSEDVFKGKFIFPKDFKTLYDAGLTEDHWLTVVEKVLALDFKAGQNLYWRMKDVMKFAIKKAESAQPPPSQPEKQSTASPEVIAMMQKSYEKSLQKLEEIKATLEPDRYAFYKSNLQPGRSIAEMKLMYDRQNHSQN